MVSRRRTLELGVGAFTAAAGCLGTPGDSTPDDHSATQDGTRTGEPPTDRDESAPTTSPGDVPEWTPEWTKRFDGRHVLGLDTADGLVYATVSTDGGPSAVAAVDPDEQSVRWRTESAGEAVAHSHAAYQGIARGQWGVTLTDDAVYAVAGPVEAYEWSAVHALDRATGERRWSLQRERTLAVAGVTDGLVVATGLEFFEPEHTHDTPEDPLSSAVYGLDVATGEVRWTREFTGVEGVAVGPRGVYVAAGDRLVGLDRDGSAAFTVDRGPSTRIEAAAGRVYYLTGEDATATLHGVAPGGGVDWTRDVPVEELLLDGDRLYAGGDAVVAVEPDGTVAWRDDDYGQWLLLDPDRDSLYTRAGRGADAATAYDVAGSERWTFDPPSNNAWPEVATDDALVASAITGDHADDPFLTVYAVDADGTATAALGRDSVFDAVGLDGTVFLADGQSNLLALTP